MKKIALLFVFTVFAFMMTNAQVTKTIYTETWVNHCIEIPCNGDWACGDVYVTTNVWTNEAGLTTKVQGRYKGELVGDLGVYTISQISNDMWWWDPNQVGAAPNTYVVTLSFELNGVPIAANHMTFHFTYNPNGELTVEVVNEFLECY